jgi:hypothetical protein
MKTKYKIYLGILILLAFIFEYYIITSLCGSDPRIGNAIQSAAVFVALLAAIIALSATDPKTKKVDVEIKADIDENHIGSCNKADLPPSFQTKYKDFPDPIISHRVQFKMTNKSGFTLNKPTLTFRLPLEKQHPHKVGDKYILTFNSNLYNAQDELRLLEFADTWVVSNSNLPFWDNGDNIVIWIRMLINDGKRLPFIVNISVNSENAEGFTKPVQIDPRSLNDQA